MYCPKCGTQNIDTAKFCRACGSDVSAVLQAITGRLAEAQQHQLDKSIAHTHESKSERTDKKIFLSLCFVVITVALWALGTGRGPWFLVFIPAFILIYRAIEKIIEGKDQRASRGVISGPVTSSTNQLLRNDPFMVTAPSVTEITTRHLDTTDGGFESRRSVFAQPGTSHGDSHNPSGDE